MEIRINMPSKSRSQQTDESLFNVYVIDYGDNYNREDPIGYNRELEEQIKNINFRPRTTREYYESMAVYYDYMDYLLELCDNDYRIFKLRKKSGQIIVPPKPKCRNKSVQKLVKKGIRISEPKIGRESESINMAGVYEMIREMRETNPEQFETEFVEVTSKKDRPEGLIEAYHQGIERRYKDRRQRKFMIDEVDFQAEFYGFLQRKDAYYEEKKKKGKKGKKKKHKKKGTYIPYLDEVPRHKVSISMFLDKDYDEVMKELDKKAGISGSEYIDESCGILTTSADPNLAKVYDAMAREGWNPYAIFSKRDKSRTGKSVLKRFKLKKGKKKKKKHKDDDSGMYEIVIGGYDDFEQFKRDMEDGSWDNVSKGGLPWED